MSSREVLLDSNTIIYAAQRRHRELRQRIREHNPSVSAVSYVETLGYHGLGEQEERYLRWFFRASRVLPLSSEVLEEAVRLRQTRRMSLGDSLVAASALQYGLELWTRNTGDFAWIAGLGVVDPLDEAEAA